MSLGKEKPGATTDTPLFTAFSPTKVTQLVVCNQSATPTTFRFALKVKDVAVAEQDYLIYDAPLGANESLFIDFALPVVTREQFMVRAGTANVSFTLFGDILN